MLNILAITSDDSKFVFFTYFHYMNEEYPAFGFGLVYSGRLVYCEVTMQENAYSITFNAEWVASIECTENFTWIQASGTILPQEIIDEIGFKIESQFK